jgi:uridylate kinase
MIRFKRILLKLSGESLLGNQSTGIDTNILMKYIHQIVEISQMGVEIGIVIGGGNIFRGMSGVNLGFDRVKADFMGMLATVINGLGILSAFESVKQNARLFTSFSAYPVGEPFSKTKVFEAFKNGEIVILSGGTGNPYFTTDTAAALRGIEIEAEVLLKGTRVDGIYTADPEKDSSATKFNSISYDEVYQKGLKIMDLTAFTLCKENKLPLIVFDMNKEGNLKKLLSGENIGTFVHS